MAVNNLVNRIGKIIEDNVYGDVIIIINEDKETSQFEVGEDKCYEVIIDTVYIEWHGYYSIDYFDNCKTFEEEKDVVKTILDEFKDDIIRQFFKLTPVDEG